MTEAPSLSWQPTPKQQQAITLFATGETVAKVAKLLRVDQRTLWRWRALPEFRLAVREVLSAALDEAVAVLVQSAPRAMRYIDRAYSSGRGKVDRDRLAAAEWTMDRFNYLARDFARPPDSQESRLTVSQSVSGSPADVAALAQLILGDRAEKRLLLVESGDVAPRDEAADPPPDPGVRAF